MGELFTFIVFNYICNLISYIYITAVLKVDLTYHLPLEILTLFLATLTGVSLGFFVGSIGNGSKTLKESISISTIMVLYFLSGLMVANMKIIVNNFCPVLNKINPAVLISDAFYSLSVYNTYNHYMKDIISLCILIVIFITGGFLYTRMKKFANYFRLCCILINPLDFVPACWWYNMWFYEKGILGLINSFVFLLISVSISLLLSTFSLQFSVYTL